MSAQFRRRRDLDNLATKIENRISKLSESELYSALVQMIDLAYERADHGRSNEAFNILYALSGACNNDKKK
jgi:hypothetical protein